MADDNTNEFRVERAITIAAPPEFVFRHLTDFHQWVDWSPWEGMDPDMVRTYSGPDTGVGATYEWKGSRKVGSGRMEIVDADAPNELGIKLDFIKPFKAQNRTVFTLVPDGEHTAVTWTMTGPKTILSKIMGIFVSMDTFVGKDFDKGLAQMKATIEAE